MSIIELINHILDMISKLEIGILYIDTDSIIIEKSNISNT